MIEKYLYFEPTIYVPYELDLRDKSAIKLTRMWVDYFISLFDYQTKII